MSRPITVEDLYQIKFLSAPRISPDGQRVAFVVTTIDERKHEYHSAIWMSASVGGEAQRFTTQGDAHSPCWSPDGRWLAFVSEREGEPVGKDDREQKKHGKGKPQIWLIPTDGGEACQLTFMEHGASHPVWSPDSTQLVFNALVGPADEETEDGQKLPKVRVIDRLWYRLDGVGFIYERRQHLFLIPLSGGDPAQLTDGDWDDDDAAWSPDGTHVAFVSSRAEDRWRSPTPDLYTLAVQHAQAGELRCLTDGSIACSSPSWSPDSKIIAFIGSSKHRSAGHNYLYTSAADVKSSSPNCLTRNFAGTCMDWTNSDIGDEHLIPRPAWSSDGQTIYVLAAHHGATRIYAVATSGSPEQPPTLTPGNVHVRDFSIDASAGRCALLLADATHVQEIFVCSTATPGELRPLTSMNAELFNELTLSTPEYMLYKGADGWDIDGWILKPHDFDPAQKYPLIVE